ncbi:glutathione S-transferase C-terminal domain-containing protein [Sneathiella limimaris]|uniref:glutathione S-transferase C-terminal domain-containing protein n=1 Tax=Sneathiella limimaris TaxID=1964213 RepID=UPI00146E241F|nr:glutathione S-transferase C-terminal domain-containing protein [Sneathiella limimaris]
MGMLVDGKWVESPIHKNYGVKEKVSKIELKNYLTPSLKDRLKSHPDEFILLASKSCPWSHRVLITVVLKGFSGYLPIHYAGGPRVKGYAPLPKGPLSQDFGTDIRHVHQLYSLSDPNYTGRSTVPILWDRRQNKIISNESDEICRLLDSLGGTGQPTLLPNQAKAEILSLNDDLTRSLFQAVYKAGLAENQSTYEHAYWSVFNKLDYLEEKLQQNRFLLGNFMTLSDIYLFTCLVRFDAVYYTHFRCSYKRLIDYPNLWAYSRRLYQMPGISQTVDFKVIREGYYLNDGNNNPHKIVGLQPAANWLQPISTLQTAS